MRFIPVLALLVGFPFFPAQAETKRNYSGVKTVLEKLAAENPGTASLFTLAETDGKEKVIGLKVGNGPLKNLVVSTHHGNEYGSAEVALAVAESLVKEPFANQTIFIIPVLNITGYNKRQREEKDAKGISRDPNRDYPGPCGSDGPFNLKSTKALADFVEKERIINSATLHTHYPAVVYPWGISTRDLETPYTDIFRKLVGFATEESRYQTGNSTQVMYPADGTFEDYAYWKHGVWSILFELGFSHSPSEEQVQAMIRVNVPGIRRMLANAPTQLATDHSFRGRCDASMKSLDRRDE
jgi:carboxypeptidase T